MYASRQITCPVCGDKAVMNFEEGSPEQAKFAMLSGRHAAACKSKLCATGSFTFPSFFTLLCVKCGARVTGNILTMWFLWHISLRGLWKKMLPQKVHFQSKRCQFEEHSVNFQ